MQALGPEAERLYVMEGCSGAEIASRLALSERTVRAWKERAGDWDVKRSAYQGSRQGFHEELYEFARELLTSVRRQMAAGEAVPPNRVHMLMRLVPSLMKVKDYDKITKNHAKEAVPPVTPGELAAIINKHLCGQ